MADDELNGYLDALFEQAQMQFGSAIKSRWLHDRDDCPGCGNAIDPVKIKGHELLSLNAFIYRQYGVLIAYLLCGRCAKKIFKSAERNPGGHTPLHARIEKNLKLAFSKQLGH